MDVIETEIPGVLIIQPKLNGDSRGFLTELFQSDRYAKAGMQRCFVQDNLSRSARNVLRGLHLQNPNPQGKLLTVLKGAILDVAVDARLGSPTFGRHVAMELSEDNRRQFWIPRGFAHGFVVRSDSADVFYKCDSLYSPGDELVVKWDDVDLQIDWGCSSPQLSLRDQNGLPLAELKKRLPKFEVALSP
jgi:dTDP-4-dehydrorhamnose 3,5-epimerase